MKLSRLFADNGAPPPPAPEPAGYRFTKPVRPVSRVFLHCSASNNPKHDDIRVIRQWHAARGFIDVGYHFFIRSDGLVQAGRDLDIIPAAQENHNTGTIALCLHGLNKEDFTPAQFAALRDLCGQIHRAYGGRVTFHGHNEVNPHKACPVFSVREALAPMNGKGKLLWP